MVRSRPMLHNFIATSTPNAYAVAGMLSPAQTLDILWLALLLVFVGLILIEERTLTAIATGPRQRIGIRRISPQRLAENG